MKTMIYYSPFFGKKWLTILLLVLSLHLLGQNAHFEFFQASEYLSSANPWELMKDKDGFLWVLGQSVDRYDGYDFVNIKDQEEIWANYHLNADEYQRSENYIAHRSEHHFFFRQITSGKLDSVNYRTLLSAGETVDKDFFFHEAANGQLHFFFFEPSTQATTFLTIEEGQLERKFAVTDLRIIDSDNMPSISSDTKGNFYYLNREGSHVIKIDKDGRLLQRITRPSSKKSSLINCSANNTLYVAFENEVYCLKENAEKFEIHPISQSLSAYSYNDFFIKDLSELPNGDLWVCGTDRTLISYSKVTGKTNDYTKELVQLIPHDATLTRLISDETNIIWVKVQQFAILKVVPQQSLFDTYFTEQDCEGLCSFRGMIENDSGQIFASFYYGIAQIDPITKSSKYISSHLDSFAPFGLGCDKGHLLLNSGQRVNIANGEVDKSYALLPDYDTDEGVMVQDDSGNWWNGQNHVVWFYDVNAADPKWEKRIKIPGAEEYVTCMHFGATSKYIWVANKHRLLYINISSNEITKHFEMPGQEIIHAIYEDNHENLWLGTEDGLVKLVPEYKNIKKYNEKDGLPNDFVSSILSDGDSCLWLGTNSGLARFHVEKESCVNFYTEHGLSHNEFNRISAYKAKDGQMFFGGVRGINAFYPEELMQKYQQQQNIGNVILSSVSWIDEKLDTTRKAFLNLNKSSMEYFHWDKSITYEFCLTDYRNANKNQYSYILEGYDKAWSIPSKYNFAKYNSLPPGNYVFRAKAFDAKGYWNPNELAISITVHPPWWKTGWAYLIYGLIIGGVFYGVYSLLRYRIELENQFQLEQKEAQRLKELDTFKSRLFTNLTHEFRTPLTVILGMAKQLLDRIQELKVDNKLKNSMASQTQLIEQNGQSLLRIINQLLDLSKLENNVFKINLQNGDVISFFNYIVSSFKSYANQRNLALRFSTKLEELNMDFDPDVLQQILINLISNAIKFTESGGNVEVKAHHLQEENIDFLQLIVRDTGIGIHPEKILNIFDRFYQSDDSMTRNGKGTGIGLAHTKELVELMGGEVSVESTLGEGTTFYVLLPLKCTLKRVGNLPHPKIGEHQLPTDSLILHKHRANKVGHNTESSALPKLLLIEDNPDIVRFLELCLGDDYEITVAYNGRIGIEIAKQEIPDLIVSDVMMPEKDGFEVCDDLKNDIKTSHIPIVLLTAKADSTSKIHGLKRGADAYLSKPFDQEELKVRLKALLIRQQKLIHYFTNRVNATNKNGVEPTTSISKEVIRIEDAFIQKVEDILEKNYADSDFSLTQLCHKIGMSRSQLFRKMKALTGTSPSQFIRTYRLKKAKSLLETTNQNVSEIAWATGFSSLPHFSRIFQEEFGASPSETSK